MYVFQALRNKTCPYLTLRQGEDVLETACSRKGPQRMYTMTARVDSAAKLGKQVGDQTLSSTL
jgi:hypothetical protein